MTNTACKCHNKTEEEKKNCRYRIEYPEDDNCCMVSIEKNGDMNLEEVAERFGLTFQRIQQIEQIALEKVRKKIEKIENSNK